MLECIRQLRKDPASIDHAFLEEHAQNYDAVLDAVGDLDVEAYCRRADVDPDLARAAAQRIGTAASVSVLEDLGIQQAPHSTLNSYLEKLLWALTGNFARPGCVNLHIVLMRLKERSHGLIDF